MKKKNDIIINSAVKKSCIHYFNAVNVYRENIEYTLTGIGLVSYGSYCMFYNQKYYLHYTKYLKESFRKRFHIMYFCFLIDHFSPLRYSAYYE